MSAPVALDTRRRRNAAWAAGAIGYALWSTGSLLAFGVAVVLLGALAFGAFFGGISLFFGGEQGLADFGDDLPAGLDALAIAALVAALAGVAMMILGPILSTRILRRAGVSRAVGITWAGVGICGIPNLVLFWLVAFPIGAVFDTWSAAGLAMTVGVAAATAVVLGALVWWWMAVVIAPAARPAPTAPTANA